MTLADILAELQSSVQRGGSAWRRLPRGLVVIVTQSQGSWVLKIARDAPTRPSEYEENTVLSALGALFVGKWQRKTNVRGKRGRVYNVSEVEFTPAYEEA
jgi:hypothetical protein